ncbi:MAG: carbamoyl-phosphate synthase large subunit [Coriobacteriia bacterium]|nr:MAG: carbamoyl-phosphate synthase large subunit [Coriobacteriia bacterium]
MHTVLVTAIGSFSADVVIRRLHELGARVVGCDIYPREWIADSMNVDAFYHAPYATDADAYGAFIRDVCAREQVDLIMPLTDVEVDFYNGTFRDTAPDGVAVCISPRETIRLCRDKDAMARFLEESASGVRGIPTRWLSDVANEPFGGPVVIKPIDGRSSQGLSRCCDAAAWDAARHPSDPDRFIVQPLIEGPVVTVDVVRSPDGSVCAAVPREELLRTLNGAGTSVHVYRDEALEASCRALAEELGIVGCVNFEFIRAKDGYRFLECNPRFSGGVEFSCIAGYDCVGNHLKAFTGEALDQPEPFAGCWIARKYEEFVTKVDEL